MWFQVDPLSRLNGSMGACPCGNYRVVPLSSIMPDLADAITTISCAAIRIGFTGYTAETPIANAGSVARVFFCGVFMSGLGD